MFFIVIDPDTALLKRIGILPVNLGDNLGVFKMQNLTE